MGENIAVIVAHPDDEVLAFAGTICRHVDRGDAVSVLFLATGLAARTPDGKIDAAALKTLRGHAQAAGKVMGVRNIEFAEYPDNRMDTVALLDVIKTVLKFVEQVDPVIIYTHHAGDLNVDHSVIARAVMTACRPLPGSRLQKIYAGEVLSSSEYSPKDSRFLPNSYVPIAGQLARKCDALKCYSSEIRNFPHPRSVEAVEALARLRGSECGMHAAEALYLVRDVMPETPGKR
jgi:LmbE family N-acetylglucosaminyl deacetylase